MGEYANYGSERVKIGTCEDMLYLRWDQRALVTESETPLFDAETLKSLRFRFPWPWEDNVAPGQFDNPFEAFRLDGFEQPADMEHGIVQFTASNGYLVNLPCPESGQRHARGRILPNGVVVMLNGYGGSASLIGQAWRGGRLVGIAHCNGCQYPYRLEEGYEEAAAVAIRARRAALRYSTCDEIADRLLAGYRVAVPA